MRILNLFQKKGQFRPQPGMSLELEWSDPTTGEMIIFATVTEVHKKKMVVTCMTPLGTRLGPGVKVRICNLSQPWFHTYLGNVLDRGTDQRLELSLPSQELDSQQVPTFGEEEKLDYITPADYQASRSPYKQSAEVVAIGRKGLTLQTNVAIPSQTNLEVTLRLPNRPEPVPAQVRALTSATVAERKKYNTEVEFVTIPEPERQALWEAALRHHLRVTSRGQAG